MCEYFDKMCEFSINSNSFFTLQLIFCRIFNFNIKKKKKYDIKKDIKKFQASPIRYSNTLNNLHLSFEIPTLIFENIFAWEEEFLKLFKHPSKLIQILIVKENCRIIIRRLRRLFRVSKYLTRNEEIWWQSRIGIVLVRVGLMKPLIASARGVARF